MEKLIEGFIGAGLVGGLCGKIVWDWLKSGRIKKEDYVKIDGCLRNRKDCCLPKIKQDFSDLKNDVVSFKAKTDERIEDVEDRLKEGYTTFQSLNEKIDLKFDALILRVGTLNETMVRFQTVMEFVLEKKDKGE
jgi:hypothetical protein